jgi:hypothetical protein
MISRDERLLFFGLPYLGRAPSPDDDIDLFEVYELKDGRLGQDLRAYLQPIGSDGFARGYNAKIYRPDADGGSMTDTYMRFDPGVPLHEMTQWLWMQCACFNEDSGRRNVEYPDFYPDIKIGDTLVTDRSQSDTGG